MTPTRFKVLKNFLFKKRNGVTVPELSKFFFAPSYAAKAKRVIERLEHGEVYNTVYFRGFDKPLYYPSSFPYKSMEQVIGEAFYEDNWHFYEVPETRVSPRDIVVDCGAAEGLFSFLISSRCERLYLIEPVKKFCDALAKTFAGQQHVEILSIALSDRTGTAVISDNNISSSLSVAGNGSKVEVTTLDKLFFEKRLPVSYIKIDLEGYDVLALEGAKELIKANKPKIAVTTYHAYEHAEQITQLLRSLVPEYQIKVKGIFQETGSPVMLHAWIA